ncbi:MAG TPA: GYD domain-containing protein [Bradyrhizobium sp.]|nr:GYD domain-containing protein [Bradyrhizobium sp.]
MLFISSINWTEQGIRSLKDAPKRAQAAREMAKKMGVEIKEIYLTSGDTDMVAILETANGDNVAKFAMAIGAMGNIRTRTVRAWTQAEMQKLISEVP